MFPEPAIYNINVDPIRVSVVKNVPGELPYVAAVILESREFLEDPKHQVIIDLIRQHMPRFAGLILLEGNVAFRITKHGTVVATEAVELSL